MHNVTQRLRDRAASFSGWAGGTAALLALAAGVIMGANPDKPGPQVVANEAYTLVLTASPDVTQVAYGESVTFTATVRCNDPDGPGDVAITNTAGKGTSVIGVGSVSITVTSIEHGEGMIAVTANGPGTLTLSRSIDVIRVTVGAGSTDCVHKASAQVKIDTAQSYSPAGYGWSNAPSGLDPGTGDGETFEYFPSASDPGIYKATATSKNLERCHDETHAVVIKVDLDAEGCVCVTNGNTDAASRKQITVNQCAPASWDGHVTLLWEGGVKVYTAASDGVEVASGTTFANEHLPTNFWVEGTAPSTTAGDVVFRLNPVEVSCPNAEEGCDRATMTVVRVDVDVDGLAESAEETVPGGVVCVTNHPNRAVSRKMITVQRAEPTDWDGEVMLDWSAGNVKMYTAASNGVEVAAGTSFANAALPTNLWVEGTAASATAGDVILKVTPVGVTCNHADTGCDWARMTMILVDVDVEGLADPVEEDAPGAFVCVTNGPGQTVTRKQITVQQVEPTDWDGEVKLDWSAGKIKVYTASNNGVEVTSGNTFANEHLPTNFWVEGTAPSASAGDVIFRFNPVGASCPHAATGCDRVVMTILKVDLTNIKFNHDTGSSASDALNIRQDYNTPFDILNGEWVKGGTNIPACYTTNKAVTIKARFTVQPASITSADIWAVSTDSGGSLSDVIKTNVTFSGGVANDVLFQIAGKTPNCIKKTTADAWQWKAENVNGSGYASCDLNSSGPHTVYTILNEPVAPWDNGPGDNSANAWTKALDFDIVTASCNGDSLASNALAHITQYLHTGHMLTYDSAGGGGAAYASSKLGGTFTLTAYLDKTGGGNLNPPRTGNIVNCYDQAGGVVTLGTLLGIPVGYSFMEPFGYINTVNLVGEGPCNNPFYPMSFCIGHQKITGVDATRLERIDFGNHAFAEYNGRVFDACAGPALGTQTTTQYVTDTVDTSTSAEANPPHFAPKSAGDAANIVSGSVTDIE